MSGTPATFKAAMIQMRTGLDPAGNLDAAARMIAEAKSAGADYVQTPEMTNIMDVQRDRFFSAIQEEDSDASLAGFRDLARQLGIFIHTTRSICSMSIWPAARAIASRATIARARLPSMPICRGAGSA
jgi:hypothetical protein